MNRFWRSGLLVVILLLFIGGAMLPGDTRQTVSNTLGLGGIDGYAHVFFCALIAAVMGWIGVPLLWVFALVLLLGGLIELAQLWIPLRSPTWNDMAGNAAGTIIGMVLLWLGNQLLKRGRDG